MNDSNSFLIEKVKTKDGLIPNYKHLSQVFTFIFQNVIKSKHKASIGRKEMLNYYDTSYVVREVLDRLSTL